MYTKFELTAVLTLAAVIGELGRDGEPAIDRRVAYQTEVYRCLCKIQHKSFADKGQERFTNSISIDQWCYYCSGEVYIHLHQTQRALLLPPHLHSA